MNFLCKLPILFTVHHFSLHKMFFTIHQSPCSMALLLWLYAHIDECGIHTHELGTSAVLELGKSTVCACEELGPPQIWALGRSWVQTGRRGCPEVDIYAAEYDSIFVNIQYFLTLNVSTLT